VEERIINIKVQKVNTLRLYMILSVNIIDFVN
jgi:hypothetical protein